MILIVNYGLSFRSLDRSVAIVSERAAAEQYARFPEAQKIEHHTRPAAKIRVGRSPCLVRARDSVGGAGGSCNGSMICVCACVCVFWKERSNFSVTH